jgi:hypothetical protein
MFLSNIFTVVAAYTDAHTLLALRHVSRELYHHSIQNLLWRNHLLMSVAEYKSSHFRLGRCCRHCKKITKTIEKWEDSNNVRKKWASKYWEHVKAKDLILEHIRKMVDPPYYYPR